MADFVRHLSLSVPDKLARSAFGGRVGVRADRGENPVVSHGVTIERTAAEVEQGEAAGTRLADANDWLNPVTHRRAGMSDGMDAIDDIGIEIERVNRSVTDAPGFEVSHLLLGHLIAARANLIRSPARHGGVMA